MHVFTHLKPASAGKTGLGIYADGMVEHDGMVGQLLDKLKELGIENNTIVMYSTDNGAEVMSWPDGGTTMFRGEKDTNWEGGYRVPCVIRWPGVIKPGTVYNDVISLMDWFPTLADAAGAGDIKAKMASGWSAGDKKFKVHLDGFDLLPFLAGDVAESPRQGFLYWSDDGDCLALRVREWKLHFLEQRHTGIGVWREPFSELRVPKLFNLRADPFERGDESLDYDRWTVDHIFLQVPAQAIVGEWLQSFKTFPPRATAASFSIDKVVQALMPQG